MVRVVVADDHPIYVSGLQREMAEIPEIEVVGTAPDGEEALTVAAETKPDVAVLDITMPKLSGVECIEPMRMLGTKVVLLTGSAEADIVSTAAALKVEGYLLKTQCWNEVAQVVLRVYEGEMVYAPDIMAVLLQRLDKPSLTEREIEIVTHLARGKQIPAIAVSLHIEQNTVKTHLKRVYSKLGINTQGGVVGEAYRHGLLK